MTVRTPTSLPRRVSFTHSSSDEIRHEINRLCREMAKGGGYNLAPAIDLQAETPTENAVAIVEAFIEAGPH